MPIGNKKIFCSAGISHMVICPNGDVYRCMSDYNYRASPIFNVKDGWKPLQECLPCRYDSCDAYCDFDWSMKWIYEGEDLTIVKPHCGTFLEWGGCYFTNQKIEDPLKKVIHINWFPTFACNYKCRYCGTGNQDSYFGECLSAQPMLTLKEWLSVWNEIYGSHEYCFVTISGGEPLLSSATVPIASMISEKSAIDITTNLSAETNVMSLVRNRIRPWDGEKGIWNITGSPHPIAKGFNQDLFFGSLLYLKNHGYPVGVNFVAYPPQLFMANEYKRWCDEHGIFFIITEWRGGDSFGSKAQYTKEERECLRELQGIMPLRNYGDKFLNFDYVIHANFSSVRLKKGGNVDLRVEIQNTGNATWSNTGVPAERQFKVGARVFYYGNEVDTLKEFRAQLKRETFAPRDLDNFNITLDTNGLKSGIYLLKVDIVKEQEFWLEDKGAQPLRLKFIVSM